MQIKVGLMAVGVALVGTGVWAGEVPIPVSPGSTNGTVVEGRCPTFIWGAVAGARSYELVVYRAEDGSEEENPVWRQELPGSAPGWTPALDACLERGGRYAWSVRAVGPGEPSEWSSPSLFEVAAGPSEAEFEAALEIVRQYVAEAGVEDSQDHARFALGAAQTTGPASSGGLQVSGPPTLLAPAAGDSDLMVNGAAVVTTATFLGAVTASQRQCPGALGVFSNRYADCGNGTVRDNNTGLYWLKDASCSELEGTLSAGTGVWDVAEAAAAALADGTCGLTEAEPLLVG